MSGKGKAFKLFSEGKVPTDPEVKALGLKAKTRANYYLDWQNSVAGGDQSPSGEGVGVIDETKQIKKVATPPAAKIPQEPESEDRGKEKASLGEDLVSKEAKVEEPQTPKEAIAGVSEVITTKDKDGKPEGTEKKIATTIADDGIKCTIFLSLQTLALFRIAATTQAQVDGDEELTLGDFLDTCAEDFFRVRGKKLGLISSGGK